MAGAVLVLKGTVNEVKIEPFPWTDKETGEERVGEDVTLVVGDASVGEQVRQVQLGRRWSGGVPAEGEDVELLVSAIAVPWNGRPFVRFTGLRLLTSSAGVGEAVGLRAVNG